MCPIAGPACCCGLNRTLITTWVGEPWHPTQLGDHSRRNKAKAKDEVSIYGQWLNMATKDSKTQSGPREQLSLEVQWAKAHCHNVSVTSVWQNATSTKEGVQQMWTMGCNKCRQVQQMCAMDVNGVQQMRQQPWQVQQMQMATNARKQGVRKIVPRGVACHWLSYEVAVQEC